MSSSPNKFAVIGNPNIVRRDLQARITGERRYSEDIMPSDIGSGSFVYMGLVTSPYPSAKVKKIDVSKAEAAGFATLTGAEMPAYNFYNPGRPYVPLTRDVVIFAGQPVAAVASADPNAVTDGLDLVKVEYEPQPYVMDPEDALAPGAPQIWPSGNSPIGPAPMHTAFGDINAGFAQADAIVEQRFDTPIMTHFELEPTDCVAYWTNSKLYVYEKTNYAFGDQASIAGYFGMALDDVVCRNALGGATNGAAGGIFGNSTGGDNMIIAAAMSKKVGAPVKFVTTRFENARDSTNRFPIRGYLKFGGTKAGAFTAMQIQLYFNMGARGGAIPDGPDDFYNTYAVPNVEMDTYITNTNSYGLAAYQRDVGESQCHFMMECAVDMLAEKLGVDPVTFRLKNMRTKDNAVDPVAQTPYSELGQPDTFNAGVAAFGWSTKWQGWGTPSSVNGTARRGVGLALENGNKGAAFPPSSGQIQVNPDGSVIVYSGHCDQGAGTHTTIPIMAAEAIGLTSLDNVTYMSADTSVNTDSSVTAGSEGTQNGGFAMVAAAADLAKQWFPTVAAKMAPGTKASNLAFGGGIGAGFSGLGAGSSNQPSGVIYDTTNPSNSMTFQAAAALLTQPITGNGFGTPLINFAQTHRVAGTKLAEVEVDTETADVRVVNYVGALDLGRIIFPKGANSQSQGGFIGLGIGQALFEETVNDPTSGLNYSGRYINPSFLDMKVPTIMQTPDTAVPVWIEGIDPAGPFGAKGIGELCLISASPAIANALSNALGGYRFTSLPIRKEDIVAALQWMKDNGKL